jgi:hypothetical protein
MWMPPVLVWSAFLLASCATAANINGAGNRFGIITSEGIVLATVSGMATGLTNADLTRLIRAGVAETYSIQCDVPRHMPRSTRQIFWHVTSGIRYPTAVISIRLVEDSKTVRSFFADVAAPETSPSLIFMNEVSRLSRRVLPPPILSAVPAPQLIRCATDPSVAIDRSAQLLVPDPQHVE